MATTLTYITKQYGCRAAKLKRLAKEVTSMVTITFKPYKGQRAINFTFYNEEDALSFCMQAEALPDCTQNKMIIRDAKDD